MQGENEVMKRGSRPPGAVKYGYGVRGLFEISQMHYSKVMTMLQENMTHDAYLMGPSGAT